MKLKLLITCIMIMICAINHNAFSQDIIILKNGEEIKATVSDIEFDAIKYKKFENLSGPNYSLKKSEVFMIKYANGTKDVFGEQTEQKIETPTVVSGSALQTFTDTRDGETYKIVTIGTQTWMAENLTYKAGSGCWAYDDDLNNATKYGYLYNYETAKTVCPSGWHLPGDAEWETLTTYLGGEKIAGGKLKENGFLPLPGGFRNGFGVYSGIGSHGLWWSSSWVSPININAWYRLMNFENNKIEQHTLGKVSGFSVRCVRD